MKIGIITLPLHTNYGGILQAYALQKTLKELGHEAIVINKDRYKHKPILGFCIKGIGGIFKLFGKKPPIPAPNYRWQTMRRHTGLFVKEHIDSITLKSIKQVQEGDFDCFVVGSDQIWRPKYNKGFPGTTGAFLDFAEKWNVLRIAYSPSFGSDNWEYNKKQTKECTRLAKKFKAISVREASGVALCREHLDAEAAHLLDPTMLLGKEEYISLLKGRETPPHRKSLMCYILDKSSDTDTLINCIAETKGLTPFRISTRTEDKKAPIEERVQPPVENWLQALRDAEFIVTDSFHACAFSILFNKPFIVYGNKERGMARFHSLLELFGLEERLVGTRQEAEAITNKPIEWERVNQQLDKKRNESLDFLKNALKQK